MGCKTCVLALFTVLSHLERGRAMMRHGKVLVFLLAWITSIGSAFWLTDVPVAAALPGCQQCMFCQPYEYVGIFTDVNDGVPASVNYGYFDPVSGASAPQAFNGGAANDSSEWLYQAGDCNISGSASPNGNMLNAIPYQQLAWTCTVSAGTMTSWIQEASSGMVPSALAATTQNDCSSY